MWNSLFLFLDNVQKKMIIGNEVWKNIDYDSRYQVSNFGRIRKKIIKGYRYLKPFKKGNLFLVKIKNKLDFDNYYKNLEIVSLEELGKRTGHISKSKRVVEVKDNEIIRDWRSARTAAKDLFVSYQTVMDYCNKKVQKPMYNLMWEDDYFNEVFDPFTWEHKKQEEIWN